MKLRIIVTSIFVVLFVMPLFSVGLLIMFTDIATGALMIVCATAILIILIAMKEEEASVK